MPEPTSRATLTTNGLVRRAWQACRDRRGVSSLMIAGSMSTLLGMAALAVDGGLWQVARRNAGSAADTAAMAAAVAVSYGRGQAGASAVAIDTARRNGFTANASTTITTTTPLASGPYAGDPAFVEVVIRQAQPVAFSRFLTGQEPSVTARAVATLMLTTDACVLALTGPLIMTGNSITAGPACILASNYTSSDAIQVGNTSQVRAWSLYSAGGCSGCISPFVALEHRFLTYSPPLENVFQYLDRKTLPTFTSTRCMTPPSSGEMLPYEDNGGKAYCSDLSLSGNASLQLRPGTYYFNEASFRIQSGVVRCVGCGPGDGVTIIFTGANVSKIGGPVINATADIRLQAPRNPRSDMDYRGVLFFRDPRATNNNSGNPAVAMNGGASTVLEGGMYFPNAYVRYNGGDDVNPSECTVLIGGTINLSGSGTTNVNIKKCPELGTPIPRLRVPRLAG
jgi:hypothetical protein